MGRWGIFLLNLLLILFVTGFAWTFFMIIFSMVASIMIIGVLFANALDSL
jgi:hypothetical protein